MHAIQRFILTASLTLVVQICSARDVVELYQSASRAVVGIGAWMDQSNPERPGAFGTGAFITPSGLVLTSITVVPDDAKAIRLYLKGGRTIEARRLLSLPDKELVLLK